MSSINQVVDTLLYQDELNPKFWDNPSTPEKSSLRKEVRKKLMEISDEFFEYLDLDLFISDITMTGSLANFNWSDFSDVDLHFIFDYKQVAGNEEIYKEYFNLKKTLFNSTHDIKIFGHDVEIYIQDLLEPHHSTGVYSVLHNDWLNVPKKEDVQIDKHKIFPHLYQVLPIYISLVYL